MTCDTSCRDQTREGRVKEEVDCTMLSVDGGFSIDIIFDHSLWRWEQSRRKEMEEANMGGGERKKERERMEKKKHELAVNKGWDHLRNQTGGRITAWFNTFVIFITEHQKHQFILFYFFKYIHANMIKMNPFSGLCLKGMEGYLMQNNSMPWKDNIRMYTWYQKNFKIKLKSNFQNQAFTCHWSIKFETVWYTGGCIKLLLMKL